MNYTIRSPQEAPDWFVPGIECKVKTKANDRWSEVPYVITWVTEKGYVDEEGTIWEFAKPVETEYIQLPYEMFKQIHKLEDKKNVDELNNILHEYGCEVKA